ncbi:uncharacterized protein LOC117653880 [Thrips palmi]|uniref:Uncharacterized protein LOC117653880 n=1 Tax=Thrips palmi TaxID=161013 RepID=A0A6P9AJX5_THRPL|nr:uncharacterized protein LOC117653880 [Thrips palmi]
MAGNGQAGPALNHPQVAEDMNLFHKQHPSTPPPRFSSPSRLQSRTTKAERAFRTAAKRAATSTLLQGIVWTALGALAVLLHYGMLPVPDITEEIEKWNSWEFIMYNMYFKENAALPDLPEEGVVSATQMLYFSIATLAANALMLLLSFVLLTRLCCGANPRADLAAVVLWAASVIVVTTVDVMVAAAMVRDLVLLESWQKYWPDDGFTALRLCPGAVLALALRGGVLLLANVACMLLVLRRLHNYRNQGDAASASQAATKADGPIDGFLYPNGDKEGMDNPVFVPDEAEHPWRTFKPDQNGNQRANAHPGHDLGYLSKDDPEDISHLMWMEEVDKHVDVHVRRGRLEDRPPPHHRYGFVEDAPPQHHVEDHHLSQHFPSGRLRAALGPLSPGPLPVGYPETGQGLRLSRAALADPPSHVPSHALFQAPTQTHYQGPPQAPSHALFQAPTQTHYQGPPQAPSHALFQPPSQTHYQGPPQAPSHALFQPPSQTHYQGPPQAPSHALFQPPSQAPSHALFQAPSQTHYQGPSQAPSHALFQPPSQPHFQAPQAPALPPVDYSPPARRRGDGGAADRALAAGRANLRPVRQDRF